MRRGGWFVLLSVLFQAGYADYSFDFYCRGDTLKQVNPNEEAHFYFTITNTGNQADVYELFCLVLQEVPGWSAIYCVRGRCVEPGIPMFDTLVPGESDTTVHLTVFTTGTEGEEVVSMRVTSLGNPALSRTIITRTRVGAGVQEPGAGWVTGCRESGTEGVVFDKTGRRVQAGSLAPGVYFVVSGEPLAVRKVLLIR